MVAIPKEAGKDTLEKSAANSPAVATGTPASSGLKAWLPLIISLLTTPILAYIVTSLVLVPKLQKTVANETGGNQTINTATAKSGESKNNSPAGKQVTDSNRQTSALTKLVVNVANTEGKRFLMAGFTLVGSAADFKARVERNDAQLRDTAIGILRAKTINDLERNGALNMIRSELITSFNSILGPNLVEEMFITEFAIQ